MSVVLANPIYRYEDYRFTPQMREVMKLVDDLKRSLDRLNQAFQIYSIPISFDGSRAIEKIKMDVLRQASLRNVLEKKFKGVLEPEHIMTLAAAILRFISTDNDLVLWGTYQLGKTLTFCSSYSLLPIVNTFLKPDTISIPVIWTPSNNNVKTQTKKELDAFLAVYGDVDVIHKARKLPFSYVRSELRDNIFGSMPTAGWDKFVLNRNPSGLKTNKEDVVEWTKKLFPNYKLEFHKFVDEVQQGSAVRSMHESAHDDYQFSGHKLRSFYISATITEIAGVNKISIIPHWVGKKYQGPVELNQCRLPTVDPNHKNAIEYVRLSKLLGQENYDLYQNRHCFVYENKFHRTYGNKESWQKFRRRFIEGMYEMYVDCTDENGGIVFCRPFELINECRELAEQLTKFIAEVGKSSKFGVVNYSGDLNRNVFKEGLTIKEILMDDFIKENKACLLIHGKGRGKAGDSYPTDCKHYIFFNDDPTYWETQWQELHRAAGNFKQSTVYIPDEYYDSTVAAIKNGCRSEQKRFNSRTSIRNNDKKRRGPRGVNITVKL